MRKPMRTGAAGRPAGAWAAGLAILPLLAGAPAHADLRDGLARCAAMPDAAARLACFDAAAAGLSAARSAAADAAAAALGREFRFDRGLMTGDFSFRIAVNGSLLVSRGTAAAREVEAVVRRAAKAIGPSDDWRAVVTVHGASVTLSRGSPYTGDELLFQAQAGMKRTGLPEDRYAVVRGADAEPVLWDDGRIRSANEHIEIDIRGFGEALTR